MKRASKWKNTILIGLLNLAAGILLISVFLIKYLTTQGLILVLSIDAICAIWVFLFAWVNGYIHGTKRYIER